MSWVLDGPWQRREVVWPGARIAGGLVGIWVAYFGASATLDWTEQSWWMAVAAIALIVALSGVAAWIRVGLRNLRYLERLMLGTARVQFAAAAQAISADVRTAERVGAAGLVTVAGTNLLHRSDCLLVSGKSVAPASRDHELQACGMCL